MKQAVSLDDLMLFQAVVAAGAMSSVAERLGMAKSTVSRTIERLERQMGTMLIKRTSRRLVPTDIGRDVYERCKTISEELAKLGDATEESRLALHGTLRVSMPNEFGSAWLGLAVSEFAIRYPDLRLEIDVNARTVDLLRESYDIAIHLGPLASSQLTYRRVASLERGIYASAGYLRSATVIAAPDDLEQHTFVLTEVLRREGKLALRQGSARRTIKPTGRVQVNSMRIARELVAGGVGLGVLPVSMAERYVHSGSLMRVLPDWRMSPLQTGATVLSREGIPRKTRVFLDFIAERLKAQEQPVLPSS
jgi:DNA-binding transcriptional LysR family regulator